MCLLLDDSQILLYISGFSVYNMSRKACQITNGFYKRFHDNNGNVRRNTPKPGLAFKDFH
jgi:hypothetical protein